MAKKISQLTQATEVKSDDVTVIVQDGETKKLPLNMMVTKQDIENKKVAGLAKLDEIEATYENDTYTPTITVKNKSSVKVGEGDEVDYSANVMDGHAKSAILSGNTESIIDRFENGSYNNNFEKVGSDGTRIRIINPITNITNFSITLNDGFQILCWIKKNDGTVSASSWSANANLTLKITDQLVFAIKKSDNSSIIYEEVIQAVNSTSYKNLTELKSVKMPVLTTTGENLIDSEIIAGWLNTSNGEINNLTSTTTCATKDLIKVKPATQYSVYKEYNKRVLYAQFNEKQEFINFGTYTHNGFTTDSNAVYVRLFFETPVNEELKVMLYEGGYNSNISYEPYKSNILSTSEGIELRGIGDVVDTLDCLTGEVVERIGEINTASMDTSYFSGYALEPSGLYRMTINIENLDVNGLIKCDKLPVVSFTDSWNLPYECIATYVGGILLYLKDTPDVESFVNKAIGLDLIIQYGKAQNSIKTVDLMPSGTHPSTTPYCWKNGHIQLSSSGLLPNLEYSVVTSRAGQINQNATMIVKNDKRIFDLEILLAGGLVNTTYQALTLQNQVETGLSKVSLSSETEPDYLLYHMIMKLIEEKAYKLDDLTEKVSVFYLYEKLSDEQFETIYSALYPFVEDEIIEEPVVEELLEEVENGVVM